MNLVLLFVPALEQVRAKLVLVLVVMMTVVDWTIPIARDPGKAQGGIGSRVEPNDGNV